MDLPSAIRTLLSKSSCEKLIRYDGRTLDMGALGAELGGAKFNLASFKTSIEKVREASEAAMAMDDYQYEICKIASEYDKGDPERKQYNRWRVGALGLFASLRIALAALKEGESDPLKRKLESMIEDMQNFVRAIANAVAPTAPLAAEQPEEYVEGAPEEEVGGESWEVAPSPHRGGSSSTSLGGSEIAESAADRALSRAFEVAGLSSDQADEIAESA